MRARYSAFALHKIPFLEKTIDPQVIGQIDTEANRRWAERAQFKSLQIISSSQEKNKGTVEFKAEYQMDNKLYTHHEKSRFRRHLGKWFYRDGKVLTESN